MAYDVGMELACLPDNQIAQSPDKLSRLIDNLRQDHRRLSGEIAVLEAEKNFDNIQSWKTLQVVCVRLSTGLFEHIQSETRLLVTRNHSLGAAASQMMSRPSIDHYGDYRYLQVISRSITSANNRLLLRNRYQMLQDFLGGLRDHMDQQEADLFPAIERMMGAREVPMVGETKE